MAIALGKLPLNRGTHNCAAGSRRIQENYAHCVQPRILCLLIFRFQRRVQRDSIHSWLMECVLEESVHSVNHKFANNSICALCVHCVDC